MKIAPRQNRFITREYQGVVGGTVDFYLQYRNDVSQSIARGSMDLWHATKRISVLQPIAVLVRFHNRTGLQQPADVRRGMPLPRMGTHSVNAGIAGGRRAQQHFESEGPYDIRAFQQGESAIQGQTSHRSHELSAVEQRKPLFSAQSKERNAGLPHRHCSRKSFALEDCLPFSRQDQGQVRGRRQVSAGPYGSSRTDHGMHSSIQHFDKRVYNLRPNPGKTLGQRISAQQQRCAYFRFFEQLSDSARMTA